MGAREADALLAMLDRIEQLHRLTNIRFAPREPADFDHVPNLRDYATIKTLGVKRRGGVTWQLLRCVSESGSLQREAGC